MTILTGPAWAGASEEALGLGSVPQRVHRKESSGAVGVAEGVADAEAGAELGAAELGVGRRRLRA